MIASQTLREIADEQDRLERMRSFLENTKTPPDLAVSTHHGSSLTGYADVMKGIAAIVMESYMTLRLEALRRQERIVTELQQKLERE